MEKLTINNIDKLIGRQVHANWEVLNIVEAKDYYDFELTNPGVYKNIRWAMKLDRDMWGDGYRLFIRVSNPSRDVDIYFWPDKIKTIDGFCEIANELINNADKS